jgi:hypothetical protein
MINAEFHITGDLEGQFDTFVEETLDNAADAAREEWIRLANASDLKSVKEEYINGIGEVERTAPDERKIALEGFLPNALENGMGSFDMKPGLLKGRDHVAIPMMYGAPKNTQSLATLPPSIFKEARKLKMGEKLSDRINIGKSKKKAQFAGLQKTVIGKTGPMNNAFVNFKTVSVNSPAGSWIHPGLSPLNLAEQVQSFIEAHIDDFTPDTLGD